MFLGFSCPYELNTFSVFITHSPVVPNNGETAKRLHDIYNKTSTDEPRKDDRCDNRGY